MSLDEDLTKLLGFVNAGCNLVLSLAGQALLVVLFEEYLPKDVLEKNWICAFMYSHQSWWNGWISSLSWIFLVIMFSPFITEMYVVAILGIPFKFEHLMEIPPSSEVDWVLLISTVVWALGCFDTVGSVAGEVQGTIGKHDLLNLFC